MYVAWTKHIRDPEEKAKFEKDIWNSVNVLDRLIDILNEQEASLIRSEANYDNPNWAYKQADSNGYKRCLTDVIKLIDLDQQEK